MKILIPIIAALLLAGCMTERKRADVFHRYARENRAEVLEYCPPVKTEVKPGRTDTVTMRDTVIRRVPVVTKELDTVWVDCPETEAVHEYIYRTDTLYRENRAELERLMLEREDYQKQIAAETALREAADQRAKNRLWAIIGLGVALVAGIFLKLRGIF